ncbi:MAG: M20 family metallopeptidase [Ruminococcaceae bacterium]|nr:M20 family metallopeptidase [Oscillospiraceae bacterium]
MQITSDKAFQKSNSVQQVFETIDANLQRYIDFLCHICSYEARAYDKVTIDRMADYIVTFSHSEGFQITRTPMESCGDFLTVEINPGKEKAGLFMAHMDTVFDKGAFGQPPVRREGDRITGPGVIDCKGGIAIALLCMKALLDHGFDKHVRLILTSDEEVSNILGGEKEQQFFREQTAGFPCAINCETAEKDQVVVGRKAILMYRLDIKGVGGHAGKHVFTAKNAAVEAAYKIIALHEKSVPGGTTYSCNIVSGGTAANVIPDSCSVTIDIRALTVKDMETATQELEAVARTAFVPGTTCTVNLLSTRPPMEKTPQTLELLNGLLNVCHKYGLGGLTPIESGGGSDSCYTQAAGIPSICGMGGSGGLLHTTNEFLNPDSIPLRAKILAGFLLDAD